MELILWSLSLLSYRDNLFSSGCSSAGLADHQLRYNVPAGSHVIKPIMPKVK